MSGWFDSFNQAVGLTEDPAENARKASEAQNATAEKSLQLQRDMFDYQKGNFAPSAGIGAKGLASLQSATSGGQEVQYIDPRYTKLSPEETLEIYKKHKKAPDPEYYLTKPPVGVEYWRGPNGELLQKPPYLTVSEKPFTPPSLDDLRSLQDPTRYLTDARAVYDNPIYQAQLGEAQRNLDRSLRMSGRPTGTVFANASAKLGANMAYDTMGRLIDLDNTRFARSAGLYDLGLAQEQNRYNRLLDLVKIGQGAAASTGQAAQNYGTQAGNTLAQMGANTANSMLAGGLMRQGQSQNNFNNTMSLATLGMKGYDYGKQQGWWGQDNGQLWNDSGGDINKVDFGNDWGTWSDGSTA